MKTLTKHKHNGDVREQSRGKYFPYIVVAIGNVHHGLKWAVQRPDGSVTGRGTLEEAHRLAKQLKDWSISPHLGQFDLPVYR